MNEEFARGVSEKPPWWATAPIWLAAGIVGVPSLIAIGAGYFLASTVTSRLAALEQSSREQVHLMREHLSDQKRNVGIMLKFVDDNLRAQFQTCINSGKTAQERAACVSPKQREKAYGFNPDTLEDPPQQK